MQQQVPCGDRVVGTPRAEHRVSLGRVAVLHHILSAGECPLPPSFRAV